jgi:hypothetical protein
MSFGEKLCTKDNHTCIRSLGKDMVKKQKECIFFSSPFSISEETEFCIKFGGDLFFF